MDDIEKNEALKELKAEEIAVRLVEAWSRQPTNGIYDPMTSYVSNYLYALEEVKKAREVEK